MTQRSLERGVSARIRRCALYGMLPLLVALAGCQGAIIGEWHMVRCVPNKEVFCIDEAHFFRDGSFSATTTIEGRTTDQTGTYVFNGYKLKLRPQAGGEHSFGAALRFTKLEIIDGDRKVILKKGRRKKRTQQE